MCGLDIAEKAAMAEKQIRAMLDTNKYHTLKFRTNGRCPEEPTNQDSATVDFRIFAQSRDEKALLPQNFLRPVTDIIMESYPGATFAVDTRQGVPKPYYEYFVTLLPQSDVKHVAVVPSKHLRIDIPHPTDTLDFLSEQPSYETDKPVQLDTLGPTVRAPLGHIVHARSGDKGSDANVGFFVRNADEWDWLRSLLSTTKIRELLADDDSGGAIHRFELPNIWGEYPSSTAACAETLLILTISLQLYTSFSRIIWTEVLPQALHMTSWVRTLPSIFGASTSTSLPSSTSVGGFE